MHTRLSMCAVSPRTASEISPWEQEGDSSEGEGGVAGVSAAPVLLLWTPEETLGQW